MAIVVKDRPTKSLETEVVTQPPARLAGIGKKKLLMVPVVYAVVLTLFNGPNQDRLARGAIYGAMIAGSGLAAAFVCAKSWREVSSILAGVIVGTICLFTPFDLGIGIGSSLLSGPLMGWLAMRPFRPEKTRIIPEVDHRSEPTDLL